MNYVAESWLRSLSGTHLLKSFDMIWSSSSIENIWRVRSVQVLEVWFPRESWHTGGVLYPSGGWYSCSAGDTAFSLLLCFLTGYWYSELLWNVEWGWHTLFSVKLWKKIWQLCWFLPAVLSMSRRVTSCLKSAYDVDDDELWFECCYDYVMIMVMLTL